MIELAEKMTHYRKAGELGSPEDELEKVADEFVDDHGVEALGDIDTPAFIRKASNVTLMPPKELLRRQSVVMPDKKIVDLVAVLRGWDLSPAA